MEENMNEQIRVPVDQQAPQSEALNLSNNENDQQQQFRVQVESQYMTQQLRGKFITCGQVVKRFQLCQILVVSINLLVVSLLAIIFSKVDSLKYLQLHISTAILQAFVLLFHCGSLFLLKLNIKQLDENLPRKTCRYQLKICLCIVALASIAGAFLLSKMLKSAVVSESMKHQLTNYDSIVILSDLLLSIFGLQILAIFFLIVSTAVLLFYVVLLLIHFLVWIFSNRQVSVLNMFQKWLYKQISNFHNESNQRLQKLSKRINFNNATDRRRYQHQNCSICLEQFEDKQKIYELPCLSQNVKHSFHSQCLEKWMVNSGECPYCRTPLRNLFQK